MSDVVRLISGGAELMLDACDGKKTIAQASGVFSHIDLDFKNWGTDVAGRATPATPVAVYEQREHADFAKMFGTLADDPSKLVLEQDQVLNFIQKYRNWLRQDGWETFFILRSRGKFFVAFVYCFSYGHLDMYLDRFKDSHVWSADYRDRLVVPQLQPFGSVQDKAL